MLGSYLEKTTQKKVQLFMILYLSRSISVHDLSKATDMSLTTILSLIDELNYDFQGIAQITKNASTIQFQTFGDVPFLDTFHAIHQRSNVLACLRFLLMNDNHEPFSEFAESHFLTRPSAYRIRQTCVSYLHAIGLDVDRNKVVGEEYRIRFFIALLHYKYGIDCYEMDYASIQIAREFSLATNHKINMRFLEHTSAEYGYFEYLLILSWKRKSYPVDFQRTAPFEALKQLFVYPKLKLCLKEHVENKLHILFSEADYDYIFLVYCCANNCLFADQWEENDITQLHSIIGADPEFSSLIRLFEEKYGSKVANSHAFHTVIEYFYKKSLFHLQCIIPDKHFYIDSVNNASKITTRACVDEVIRKWQIENNIPYGVGNGHLQYLTLQIFTILQQFMDPIRIIIVSFLFAEIEVLKLYLTRAFSPQRVTIVPLLFNVEDYSTLHSLTNSIIIVKKIFAPAVAALEFAKDNTIVPINIEINEIDRRAINQAVLECEKKAFQDFFNNCPP